MFNTKTLRQKLLEKNPHRLKRQRNMLEEVFQTLINRRHPDEMHEKLFKPFASTEICCHGKIHNSE